MKYRGDYADAVFPPLPPKLIDNAKAFIKLGPYYFCYNPLKPESLLTDNGPSQRHSPVARLLWRKRLVYCCISRICEVKAAPCDAWSQSNFTRILLPRQGWQASQSAFYGFLL